jgi:hypothetical protein
MIMTDVIFFGKSFASEDVASRIAGFAVYPHASHYLAAWLASATGISPLQAIHCVANAATIASAALIALRLSHILRMAHSLVATLVAGAVAITVLYFFATWGIGYSGQLQWNYFYPQAVGTAFALGALIGFQYAARQEWCFALVVLTPLAAFVLASFHPTPAVWVAACGASCVMSCPGSISRRALQAMLTGILCIAAMVAVPSFRWLLGFLGPSAQGDVNTFGQRFNLSHEPKIIMVSLGILALALIAATVLRGYHYVFRTHAGGVGVLACGAASAAPLFATGTTEYYSIAKYAFIYGAELALVAATLSIVVLQRLTAKETRRSWVIYAVALGVIPIATLAQKTFVTDYVSDQRPLIQARTQAEAGYLTIVPPGLDKAAQYYFAVSFLHEPMWKAITYLVGNK